MNDFLDWVQKDLSNDQSATRKRYTGMLVWCLGVPLLSMAGSVFFKFLSWSTTGWVFESVFFLSPLGFSAYTFLRSAKNFPEAFRRGGAVGILDQAKSENIWASQTAQRLFQEWNPSDADLDQCRKFFDHFIQKQRIVARNFAILAGVSLFFVSYFLDFSTTAGQGFFGDTINSNIILNWASDISRWTYQALGILLISLLMYSIGNQSILTIERYRVLLDLRPKN